MRIAQVVCTIPPYGGGIGVVAHQYAEKLIKRGHQVDVFVPRSGKTKKKMSRAYELIKLYPWLRFGNAALLPQLFWKLRKYDIVHLHFPFLGACIFVYLLKLLKGKKMVLVISYHMDLIGSGVRKKIFKFYNKHFLLRNLKVADKIIVSSYDYLSNSNIADYYEKYPEKFVEIPFGVPSAYFSQQKNPSLMKKYHFSLPDKIIGFVGGLDSAHYFKGVNYLITAISKIENQNVKALIVGEGNLRKKYMQEAEQLGVANRIIFAGYVENDFLPEHYNLFDIFILPSIDKSEAFGIVLLEAMACGVPLLASNLKGVRSVVIPGENGLLVEPKNAKDIADKINHLLKNEKLMKDFGLNGIELVNKKYRWPIIAAEVEAVYKKIINHAAKK